MPFRSENQRRYLWANHPEIARRWTQEHGSKPVKPPDRSAAIKRRLDKTNPVPRRTARGLGPRATAGPFKRQTAGPKKAESGLGGVDDKLKKAVMRRLKGN